MWDFPGIRKENVISETNAKLDNETGNCSQYA